MGILLLLISVTAGLRGDDIDDDDCCVAAQPIRCAIEAQSAIEPRGGPGCPETYLGNISGVHWYDVYKTQNCFGHIVEGVPYGSEVSVCPDCSTAIPYFVFASKIQPGHGNATDKFKKPSGMEIDPIEDGYAQIDTGSGKWEFRLLEVERATPPKGTRPVGVEVKWDTGKKAGKTTYTATWSTIDTTGSKRQHFIDVKINSTYHRYRVTTVEDAVHNPQ